MTLQEQIQHTSLQLVYLEKQTKKVRLELEELKSKKPEKFIFPDYAFHPSFQNYRVGFSHDTMTFRISTDATFEIIGAKYLSGVDAKILCDGLNNGTLIL